MRAQDNCDRPHITSNGNNQRVVNNNKITSKEAASHLCEQSCELCASPEKDAVEPSACDPCGTTGTKLVEDVEAADHCLHETDVCIIGSGPDALCALSALHEPLAPLDPDQFRRAINSKGKRRQRAPNVCVISPSGAWLRQWEDRFSALGIEYLRSPASAHPDMFSAVSLLHFVHTRGHPSDLVDVGVRSVRELSAKNGQSKGRYLGRIPDVDTGLFDIPSQKVFIKFCRNLASKLPHQFVQGRAVDIDQVAASESPKQKNGILRVDVLKADGTRGHVLAGKIIVAIGAPGPHFVPELIRHNVPRSLYTHTNNACELQAMTKAATSTQSILVVGGGLSAVQAALAFENQGAKVVLASRRPLSWRHFDLPVSWFDRRTQNRVRHGFFATSIADRPALIREAKGGGTVPPWYRNPLANSSVQQVVAHLTAVTVGPPTPSPRPCIVVTLTAPDGSVRRCKFDHLVLGTGSAPDCLALPLVAAIQRKWPIEIKAGLPVVEQSLRWGKVPIYVTGGLAALRVGPTATNLMGARQCAQDIADEFGVYDVLDAPELYSVHSNKFAALFGDDSTSSEEDSSECSD